jgi:hypothetical protein
VRQPGPRSLGSGKLALFGMQAANLATQLEHFTLELGCEGWLRGAKRCCKAIIGALTGTGAGDGG